MKRKILTLLSALFILLGAAACSSANADGQVGGHSEATTPGELKLIKIGNPSESWPSGVYGVAIEEGYLAEELEKLGYTFERVGFAGAAPVIHEALVAKELDYVVYAGMAGVLSKANTIDHTLLSTTSWGASWMLVVQADSDIETLEDLRGKKIGYQRGASPHMYAIKVLNEGGLTFDDIEPITTTLPEGVAALAAGSIDGAVVGAGDGAMLVAEGTARMLHFQFDADPDVYFEPMVFIARTEFHKANPDVAVAIQKAFLRARDWIREDPDRYFELVAEKTVRPLEIVLQTASYDIDAAFPLDLDDLYINSLKEILEFLRANELTSGEVDFEAWIDRSVVEKALEEYSGE